MIADKKKTIILLYIQVTKKGPYFDFFKNKYNILLYL